MDAIRQTESTERIVLTCPECGYENSEYLDVLRGIGSYFCRGDDCDYVFDLVPGRRTDFGKALLEACRRFYAAFYALRGEGAR